MTMREKIKRDIILDGYYKQRRKQKQAMKVSAWKLQRDNEEKELEMPVDTFIETSGLGSNY